MVVFENVTANMSIATGIGVLANKIAYKKNLYNGVDAYKKENSGYVKSINAHLANMNAEIITY